MARGRPSKKAHIIDAACRLFTKQGYQSTSIDQVVIAAEVSKPTVYSNFPTKLVLWENVLTLLIQSAEEDMDLALSQLLSTLESNDTSVRISAWISLWEVWTVKAEHLAVYRILLGEQHKMASTTVELFDQFETVLESSLAKWLSVCEITPDKLFGLKAISKEALLMPSLMNKEPMAREELKIQLEAVIQ